MGRGNVCVTGSYEGLFYIDNDDLRVYRKDGPGTDDCEDRLQRDLDYADITGPDWYLDEVGSSYEEEDVLECFCAELRKLCPSFQPAVNSNVWLGNERRVILENELFYICVEDNEWSLAIELVQKDGYSDCESAWMAGLQKRRYRGYLDSMKKALLALGIGLGIGLYDGMVGPGTGTFAIIAFTSLMGFDLRTANGNAKVLNLASNYASLFTYLSSGLVVFPVGIPCAISNIVGNIIGSHFALRKGAKFIRPMMLVVLVLLLGKLITDML